MTELTEEQKLALCNRALDCAKKSNDMFWIAFGLFVASMACNVFFIAVWLAAK